MLKSKSETKSGDMAEVIVDYSNGTVKVNAVHIPASSWKRYNVIMTNYTGKFFSLSLYLYIVLQLYYNMFDWQPDLNTFFAYHITVFTSIWFISAGLLTLQHWFNPKGADIFFPKYMGLEFFRKSLKINILPSKDFILHLKGYGHVFFKYRANGDFKKYLHNVSIIKLNKNVRQAYQNKYWGVWFRFLKSPQDGVLELKYT